MICDFTDAGVCKRCERPQRRAGFARMCCGSPGCSADSIIQKFSPEDYAAMTAMREEAFPTHGPGTELSKLLKKFGIEPTPACQCRAKAREMDAWGPDECAKPERIEEVLSVMREEAKARGLPFLDAAGRMLIRRAIANARRAAS